MFSGIVEKTTAIYSVGKHGRCKRVRLKKPSAWQLKIGESVSVDGICSTVVFKSPSHFDVEYMPETLSKTTAQSFEKGSLVNLERSLRFGDRIHGHFVAGHVDAASKIMEIEKRGRSRLVSIQTPTDVSKYIVPRGSVAVNGVSLTVAKKGKGFFTIALIPHTLKVTNLGTLSQGDLVNVEADMMARYGRLKPHAKKKTRR